MAVNSMTYSPVGARDTVGSCAKTGWATARRVKAHGWGELRLATVWTTRELVRQDLMPVLCVISALFFELGGSCETHWFWLFVLCLALLSKCYSCKARRKRNRR